MHQLGFAHIENGRVHFIDSTKKKVLLTNAACLARLFVEFTKRSRRTQCDWAQVAAWFGFQDNNNSKYFLDTRRNNLNVHKKFRWRPGFLLNILCTFNLRSVFRGQGFKKVQNIPYLEQSSNSPKSDMNWCQGCQKFI